MQIMATINALNLLGRNMGQNWYLGVVSGATLFAPLDIFS